MTLSPSSETDVTVIRAIGMLRNLHGACDASIICAAISGGRCNTLDEYVGWCHPSEGLSRSGVKRVGGFVVGSDDVPKRRVEQVTGLHFMFDLAVA